MNGDLVFDDDDDGGVFWFNVDDDDDGGVFWFVFDLYSIEARLVF